MDRSTPRKDAEPRGFRIDGPEGFVPTSREPLLDACSDAVDAGPILLTGESGIGKTWLRRAIEAGRPAPWRWAVVDLTPANDPIDLYRLIGRATGQGPTGAASAGACRADLADRLVDDHADGHRSALVVEEAQNLTPDVWEEVRILANRLGQPDGFAALVVVGQSALARRFATRPLSGFEARLAARVHLGPIDADEALDLLASYRPDRDWDANEVDVLHRDASGNPGRLLRMVGRLPIALRARVAVRTIRPDHGPTSLEPAPLLGPGRPPLRVEDHLIEVGWSAEDEFEAAEAIAEDEDEDEDEDLTATEPSPPPAEVPSSEPILDPYASLQALRELSRNWTSRDDLRDPPAPADRDEVEPDEDAGELPARTGRRTEGRQSFAPFGPLFTKLSRADPAEPF